MAHFRAKAEPDSESEQDFGLFVDDNTGPSLPRGNSSKKAAKAIVHETEWRRCEGEDRFTRVKIKEFAVANAQCALRKMLKTLELHCASNPSCQIRIDKINAILWRKKEFKILVGFLGTTGAGKTTLLNALIGSRDLLPSSAWRASTAVPVEVSYNKSADKEALYRAEISYVTTAEWKQELDLLFEDLQSAALDAGDDEGDNDLERARRIDQSVDKIKYVYPHINCRAKLLSTSAEELLGHPEVRDVLDSTKKIFKSTKRQFAASIKRYIDSGDPDGKTSSHWPLLKMVKVFVKAPILESGIVLVDMPGSLDSNLARSTAAARYQKELSVSCIVGNITRGISEANAQELLEKITKRNLQLDGLYNPDSLCFVLSQIDQEFNVMDYIKQTPVLDESTAADMSQIQTFNGKIAELKREKDKTRKKHAEQYKRAKNLSKEITGIKSQLAKLSNSPGNLSSSRKRIVNDREAESQATIATSGQTELRKKVAGLEKQHSELEDTIRKDGELLLSLEGRLRSLGKALLFARSRLKVACIQHRNQISTAAIRKDYEATLQEMGRQATKPLQVFAVSAVVHLHYLSRPGANVIHAGFPNREDTKVADLRDWLLGTTLETRDSYAQAFLEDVEQFVNSMKPWINDKYSDMKISADERKRWEPQLEGQVVELEQKLNDLALDTSQTMRWLVKNNIYSTIPLAERLAAKQAKETAEKWAIGCHWSTHKCVNRGHGLWIDSKRREHKWNDDLVHDLTTNILIPWDRTFFQEFPGQQISYVERGKSLINEFASLAADKSLNPDVSDGLEVLNDHIIRTENLLKSQTDFAFEEITKAIRDAHPKAVPAVKSFLEPMYSTCAAEGGQGHYARNKATHKRQMESEGRAMHHEATTAIKAAVDKLLDDLPLKFATAYSLVLEQIREEIKLFFEQNSSNGQRKLRNGTRRPISKAKERLQKALSIDINTLARDWKSRFPVNSGPENDESDDEMDFNPESFVEIDNSDDEDYND